jgi:hypothetical protein
MSLRKKLELNWQGEEYSLLVTMEVIDRIDDKVNVGKLLYSEAVDDVRITKKAKLIATVLSEAGAEVSQEDVYNELMAVDSAEVNALYSSVLWAMIPEQKKKDVQPVKRQRKQKITTA